MRNPWLVTSVTDLSYYCCPECQYRSRNLDYFRIHALNNHEQAKDLFNRDEDEYLSKVKQEQEDDQIFFEDFMEYDNDNNDNDYEYDSDYKEDIKPLAKPKKAKVEKPFKCLQCDYRATKQCVLNRHVTRVHAEMVKCPECDKSVSKPRLEAHMATHVAKSVTCNECSFEAASSHSLEQVSIHPFINPTIHLTITSNLMVY